MIDHRRYHGLDALRGIMMMLGIVIHAAIYYLATPPFPLPLDRSTSPVFDVVIVLVHSFRMPLFFVLAGFFAALLVDKYGVAGSYWNRLKRVLAPLLLGLLTIVPLTMWFTLCAFITASTGSHAVFTDPAQIRLAIELLDLDLEALQAAGVRREPSPIHLWFLYYLCYFYLLLPLYGAVARWTTRPGRRQMITRTLASPWMLLVFGSVTAGTLWPFKGGVVFEGFLYFTPHLPSLLYYGTFFFLGYLFHAHREILQTFQRHLRGFALLSAVLFPTALVATFRDLHSGQASPGAHALSVVLHGFCTWSLIYLLTGAVLKYFDFESPWIRFISQSSYWVYLVHLPVVGALGWLLLPYDLSAFVKFPILFATSTVICFLSYQYLARTTWISVLLNGKRFSLDWPWREQRAPSPPHLG